MIDLCALISQFIRSKEREHLSIYSTNWNIGLGSCLHRQQVSTELLCFNYISHHRRFKVHQMSMPSCQLYEVLSFLQFDIILFSINHVNLLNLLSLGCCLWPYWWKRKGYMDNRHGSRYIMETLLPSIMQSHLHLLIGLPSLFRTKYLAPGTVKHQLHFLLI